MNIPANIKKEGAKRLPGRYEKFWSADLIFPPATGYRNILNRQPC
jgi:hypothetical protein